MGSVDSDRDGSNSGHSLHQSSLIALGNVDITDINSADVFLAKPALVILAFIGVGLLRVDAVVVFDILVSIFQNFFNCL